MRRLAYCLGFIGLNIADWLMTKYMLSHGGIETMPVASYVISTYGLSGLLILKLFMSVLICVIGTLLKRDSMLQVLFVGMLFVCYVLAVQVMITIQLDIQTVKL